ncbi:PilZ domain-containing protein [Luteitalea sp. TBR-22]|uniref:PilZ domain-containing protein n=1 Tax=Luteitalea sp. TBR-22 TaxID=2802971 RepID=UPI001EF6A5A1|nr:PilZ domain-containing protein [Luteitalea sp. TBR-22]
MPDSWTPDRRRADRRPVTIACHAVVQGEDEPWRVHELSAGGMVVASTRPLAAGDSLRFTLGAGATTIGPLDGHVAHSRLILAVRYGEPPACLAGVAFQHVSPAHAAQLSALLQALDAPRVTLLQDHS